MKDFDLGICGLYVLSCDLGMGINLHSGREGVTRRFRMSQRCGAAVLGDAKRERDGTAAWRGPVAGGGCSMGSDGGGSQLHQ
jgi:hypothetical protein